MIDVIILGLGAMGSAAAYQLAQRGKRVLGLEQFTLAHSQRSSHGGSRIIRQAYYEDPSYVPLLLRAYELWERLERDTNCDLLRLTGALMIGSGATSEVLAGSIRSASEHNLAHTVLDAGEIRRRFPCLTPAPHEAALYESKAGWLCPEECIRQHLREASRYGADLRFEEPVESWRASDSNGPVRVTTANGVYEAERLIISSGAWAPSLLAELELPIHVTRQVMFWFDPVGGVEPFVPDRFPVYLWQPERGYVFYGFPALDGPHGGAKVAIHGSDISCMPQTIDREIHHRDVALIRSHLANRIPSLNGSLLTAQTCMYTMTPDWHPIVGLHPRYPSVAIAVGFSGHGFKFSNTVGEILADLAAEGTSQYCIEIFNPKRFAGQGKEADGN